MLNRASAALIVAAITLANAPSASNAATVTLDFNGETTQTSNALHTGASGLVEFAFSDVSGGVKVDLDITNTTGTLATGAFGAGATAGTLTGFGFDLFVGLSLIDGTFQHSGGLSTLIFDANSSPFGTLDIAFADNDNFNGGNANKGDGLAAGDSAMLSFVLASADPSLTALSLAGLFGDGFEREDPLDAVLRFQQVNAGEGSDKLLYTGVTPVPLPATLPLLLIALTGGAVIRRRAAA